MKRSYEQNIRWSLLLVSALLCVVQAFLAIYGNDVIGGSLTGNLLAPFAFLVLFVFVLGVNPILGRTGLIRPLNRAELMAVLFALLVTSGVSRAGLTSMVVPTVVTPHNQNWNTPQRGWSEHLIPQLNPALYIDDQEQIAKFNEGWGPITMMKDGQDITLRKPPPTAGWGERVTYWRALISTIPWATWAKPLAYWMIFVVGFYGVFYCLCLTVIDYWSNREKLIFPHVQVATLLLPTVEQSSGRIPPFVRAPQFWLGFAIVFAFVAWQDAAALQLVGSLTRLPQGLNTATISALLQGTMFEGASGPWNNYSLSFSFGFLAIGIAFLVPLEISFSIWFYYLAVMFMMVVGVWMGFGQTMADFPSDNLWQNNPISALGGGALFLFGGVCLYRSVKDYVLQSSGRPWNQKISILTPPLGLAGFMLLLVEWFSWNNLPLVWGFVLVGTLTVISLSIMRLTAEAGIHSIHLYTGFFHVYMVFELGRLLSPLIAAAMLPICAVFFLYYWTPLGPNLLNATRARAEVAAGRARFHLNIISSIAITIVFSLGFAIFMAYLMGANAKHPWFYNRVPQQIFDQALNLAVSEPKMESSNVFGIVLGPRGLG